MCHRLLRLFLIFFSTKTNAMWNTFVYKPYFRFLKMGIPEVDLLAQRIYFISYYFAGMPIHFLIFGLDLLLCVGYQMRS